MSWSRLFSTIDLIIPDKLFLCFSFNISFKIQFKSSLSWISSDQLVKHVWFNNCMRVSKHFWAVIRGCVDWTKTSTVSLSLNLFLGFNYIQLPKSPQPIQNSSITHTHTQKKKKILPLIIWVESIKLKDATDKTLITSTLQSI